MKILFIIILMGFVFTGSIFCFDLLLIGQNENSVLPVRESLEVFQVPYEIWSLDRDGAISGQKVFEYCDDNKVIIRVLKENDTFTDDEAIILEDYLSALGALIFFSEKKDDDFFKMPLVKDYILAMKDKLAYVHPGDVLKPLNRKVFGDRNIKISEGPVQTTRRLPDAEGVVSNGFAISGQEDSFVCLLVSSCTFRMSYFTFHPDRIADTADRDYLMKKCLQYLKLIPANRLYAAKQIRIPEPGTILADFQLDDLDAVQQSLGKYVGEKGVILSYWASWCSSCNEEMPLLEKYFVADGEYQILGANFKETKDQILDFKQKHGISFPLIPDTEGAIRKLYRIPTVPVLFFIDKAGVLRSVIRGVVSEEELQSWINVISQDLPENTNSEFLLNQIINSGKGRLKKLFR